MSTEQSPSARIALWAAIAVFVVAWIWVALAAGTWNDKWVFLSVVIVIGALLSVLFLGSRRFAPRLPTKWFRVSDPHAREYWSTPDHRGEFNRRISADLEWIGAATMLFLSAILLAFGSDSGAPAHNWTLIIPVAVFVIVVLGYCSYMIFGPRYRAHEA